MAAPLPPLWEELCDDEGRPFYHNRLRLCAKACRLHTAGFARGPDSAGGAGGPLHWAARAARGAQGRGTGPSSRRTCCAGASPPPSRAACIHHARHK